MVEVESFSSENSFPLRGRDSTWGTPVDFDQEFGAGDVVVVGLEKFTGFVTAGVARVRGFVGVVPTHVGFLCLNALPRGLAAAVGLFRGLVSRWPSSERYFVEQVVDRSVDFFLFSGRKDAVSEFFVESDGIELLDVEVDRVFLFKLRKGVVAVDKGADVKDGFGFRQPLVSVLGDEGRKLGAKSLALVFAGRLNLSRRLGFSGCRIRRSANLRVGVSRRSRRLFFDLESISHNMRER